MNQRRFDQRVGWIFLGLALMLGACRSAPVTPTPTLAVPAEVEIPPTNTPLPPTLPPTATPEPTTEPTIVPTETPEPISPAPAALFESDSCRFDVPDGRAVQCGYLTVPEDRSRPDGRMIRLHVAIFKSDSAQPRPDPILYLEGGPGGDALETVPFAFEERFSPFLANRDFIMFDQRGTGYSEPSLACEEYTQLTFDTLEEVLTLEEETRLVLDSLNACRDRLVAEGVNLAAYNSAASAADVNDLRLALGYDAWNLFGISYGTRLAQTVMRDFPSGIRSAILDSTYPLPVSLLTDTPANVARAFAIFFAGCAADPACATAYPNLETTFFDLVEQLNQTPITVPVTYVFTGERYDSRLNGDDLIGILFQSLYSTELIPLMPQIISEIAAGDNGNLSILLTTFLADSEFSSVGLQLSVQCHEEIAFSQPGEAAAAVADYPQLERFFTGSPSAGELALTVCANWGAGTADPVENEPVRSDIPALILAGEYDPITPPAWGRLAAADLSRSYYYEFPGMGHGVSVSDDCPRSIALAFLDAPETAPDGGCVEAMGTGPAFVVADETAVTVTLTPFTADLGLVQLEGVIPAGWEEVGPGIYTRSSHILDQTFILQQAAPGVGVSQLLSLLEAQLRLEERPVSRGVYQAGGRGWSLYESELQNMVVDIALAPDGLYTYVVLMSSESDEREALYTAVFLPALEAIHIP